MSTSSAYSAGGATDELAEDDISAGGRFGRRGNRLEISLCAEGIVKEREKTKLA
jgi:hypothetical protein